MTERGSSFYSPIDNNRQIFSVPGEEMFLVMRDRINLSPGPLSDPPLVDSLISGSVGENEDEDTVTLSL